MAAACFVSLTPRPNFSASLTCAPLTAMPPRRKRARQASPVSDEDTPGSANNSQNNTDESEAVRLERVRKFNEHWKVGIRTDAEVLGTCYIPCPQGTNSGPDLPRTPHLRFVLTCDTILDHFTPYRLLT